MLDLLEEGNTPDEMATNTFTDFYDISFSAETLHDLSKVKCARQLLSDGYYMTSVKSFIKNA